MKSISAIWRSLRMRLLAYREERETPPPPAKTERIAASSSSPSDEASRFVNHEIHLFSSKTSWLRQFFFQPSQSLPEAPEQAVDMQTPPNVVIFVVRHLLEKHFKPFCSLVFFLSRLLQLSYGQRIRLSQVYMSRFNGSFWCSF